MEGLKKELKNIQKALLTGTSYMMPLVVAGGILFSFSLLAVMRPLPVLSLPIL